MSNLFEITNLSIQFGGLRAVDDFNLSVEKGEMVAIIGPNGAGKTTVFNMLTGIYKPTTGSIKFNDIDMIGKKPFEFAQAGIARTFQNIRLFGDASVIDNIKAACTFNLKQSLASALLRTRSMVTQERELDERAMSFLDLFGIADLADTKAKNLPYGAQRKLEIVRALMLEPQILLLDEPVAGMITTEMNEVATLVRRIRDEFGITVIMIEHHMNFVMPLVDRIKVLDFGKTIAEGTPAEVQNNPAVIEAYLGGSYNENA